MDAEGLKALRKIEAERDSLRERLSASLKIIQAVDEALGQALAALGKKE